MSAPQNPTPCSRIRREQSLDVTKKDWDLAFDRAPYERVVDEVVAVDQYVAEGDDLAVVVDARRGFGVVLCEALDRLADYLEIALDRLPQHAVSVVVKQALAIRHVADEGGGVADVLKQLRLSGLHRPFGASC